MAEGPPENSFLTKKEKTAKEMDMSPIPVGAQSDKKKDVATVLAMQQRPMPEGWTKCGFFMEKKKRFCRLQRISEGVPFCGEHLPPSVVVMGKGGVEMERVLCPLDPTHTCFKFLLSQHVARCNVAKSEGAILPYVKKDVNRIVEPKTAKGDDDEEEEQFVGTISSSVDDKEFNYFFREIINFHESRSINIKEDFRTHPLMEPELERTDMGSTGKKKLMQIGSLLHLMELNGMLNNGTAFIEFGGGRGTVTYWLGKLIVERGLKDCKIYVIDRTSPRHKQDNKLRSEIASTNTDPSTLEIIRVKVDIANLTVDCLPNINCPNLKHIVGIAKHLCGNALDMALHSLVGLTSTKVTTGVCMLTCCHHKCEYVSFMGTEVIKPFVTSRLGFEVLKRISSWATCGNKTARIDDGVQLSLETTEFLQKKKSEIPDIYLKYTIGNLAKDVLDNCRAEEICRRFNIQWSEVVYFVDKGTTLENRAIIGISTE